MLSEFLILGFLLHLFIPYLLHNIALLVAIVAATAAIITLEQNYNALKASLILNIADSFAKEEMGNAMDCLRDFFNENQKIGIKTAFSQLKDSKEEEDIKKFRKYNGFRRLISHHFFKLWRIRKMGLIDDETMRLLAPNDEIDFLLDIIEPMHQVIDKKYNQSMYSDFRRLQNNSDKFQTTA